VKQERRHSSTVQYLLVAPSWSSDLLR